MTPQYSNAEDTPLLSKSTRLQLSISTPHGLHHSLRRLLQQLRQRLLQDRHLYINTPVYPPPRHVRNVRKRHNSFVEEKNSFFTRSMIPTSTLLSHDDEITTSTRSNVTIYRALQQAHEFEP
ncbi:Uncharacterized protein Rs2_43028 [Raphanus sativus]|nr:Uncharacterized protein Rs2_43028 [Raphanus sativus]